MVLKKYVVLYAILVVNVCTIFGQKLVMHEKELLYTDSELNDVPSLFNDDGNNFVFDVPLVVTKKQTNETMTYYRIDWKGCDKYVGNLNEPLKNRVASVRKNDLWLDSYNKGGYAFAEAWISNLYECPNGDLIGFTHVERSNNPNFDRGTIDYFIGISYSKKEDEGMKWNYCGDIIKPYKVKRNIGGTPYVIKDGYFYLYFNDLKESAAHSAVARAKVDEVIANAVQDKVVTWYKYNGNDWNTELGIGGFGAHILPTKTDDLHDFHSDAAYCITLKQYFILTYSEKTFEFKMFSSKDLVNLNEELTIDRAQNFKFPYSTIVSTTSGANKDNSTVGHEFYVFYPKKDGGDYYVDDYYKVRFTIAQPNIVPIVGIASVY